MPDVHLLGDVGAAIVHDHPPRRGRRSARRRADRRRFRRPARTGPRRSPEVDEAGSGQLDRGERADGRRSALGDCVGDLARIAPAALAAASAPLHWKSARSGRSEGVTRPKLASRPAAAKAAATASPSARRRSVIAWRLRRLGGLARRWRRKRLPWRLNSAISRRHVEADQHLEVGAADLGVGARNDDAVERLGDRHAVLAGREGDGQVEILPSAAPRGCGRSPRPNSDRSCGALRLRPAAELEQDAAPARVIGSSDL